MLASLVLLADRGAAGAASWSIEEALDEFSDKVVVTASTASIDGEEELVIRCTDQKDLVSVYRPSIAIRSEDLTVRYRIDKLEVVESALPWENHNGRVRAALSSRKSLFLNEQSDAQREEFLALLDGLMTGSRFVIEAEGERASFPLAGSANAISQALAACDVPEPSLD